MTSMDLLGHRIRDANVLRTRRVSRRLSARRCFDVLAERVRQQSLHPLRKNQREDLALPDYILLAPPICPPTPAYPPSHPSFRFLPLPSASFRFLPLPSPLFQNKGKRTDRGRGQNGTLDCHPRPVCHSNSAIFSLRHRRDGASSQGAHPPS